MTENLPHHRPVTVGIDHADDLVHSRQRPGIGRLQAGAREGAVEVAAEGCAIGPAQQTEDNPLALALCLGRLVAELADARPASLGGVQLLQDGQLFEPSESLAAAIRRLPRLRTTQQRQNLAQRCLDTSGMQQAGEAVLQILTPTNS